MQTIKISATKARNNFFELLNQVALGRDIIIVRDKKEVAVLSPKKKKIDWEKLEKATESSHGIWKDYDPEDNPLRRKGAADFLGKWDQPLTSKKKSSR